MLAGTLRWEHRDPFDRLLVAQAALEGLVLVTVDRAILGLPALSCELHPSGRDDRPLTPAARYGRAVGSQRAGSGPAA